MNGRLVFMHIPKCAGSSVTRALFKGTNPDKMCPLSVRGEFSRYGIEQARKDFDYFSGHMAYEVAAQLDAPIVTILRNPIKRVISLYKFLHSRSEDPKATGAFAAVRGLSWTDYIQSDDPYIIVGRDNAITYSLVGRYDYDARAVFAELGADEMLDRAMDNLRKCAHVGFVERLSDSETALSSLLGKEIKFPRVNVSQGDTPRLSRDELNTLLTGSCAMDVQLYMAALAEFG